MGKKLSKSPSSSPSCHLIPEEAFGVLCNSSLSPSERIVAFDFLRLLYVPSKLKKSLIGMKFNEYMISSTLIGQFTDSQ
ncbi:hypothetical protein EON65_20785 [archaeon]|nr:MAG: hypothetical protein EON65_20785 [archaeon]